MVTLYFIILTSVEVLLYFFHLSVLIVLTVNRNKKFQGSFFNIFRTVLVADILCFLSLATVQKVSLLPFLHELFETSLYFPNYVLNLASFTTVVQFLGHTLMPLNRFTLIWLPTSHTVIWRKKWYIIFMLIISFLTISIKIHQPATFKYLSDDRTTVVDFNTSISSISLTIRIIVYTSTTIISAIINVLTVVKIRFYKQASNNITVNEKNLFSLSFIIFVTQCLRSFLTITSYFLPSDNGLRLFAQSATPIIYDIYALSGSVTLLVLSETLRKEYVHFYFPKRLNKTNLSSIPSSIQMYPKNETGTVTRAFQIKL